MAGLTGSVGSRGRNRRADVVVVQRLLNRWLKNIGLDGPLIEDGLAGRKTVLAIVEFQGRVVGMDEPDGRVDPDGTTLKLLKSGQLSLKLLPKTGVGYYGYGVGKKRYGTAATLASIKRVAKSMDAVGISVGVGNISYKAGGPMRPHASHQRGVDVDFRPLRIDTLKKPVTIDDASYSAANTKVLVRALKHESNVDIILFNDDSIRGVKFWTGHDNHLHVRFKK